MVRIDNITKQLEQYLSDKPKRLMYASRIDGETHYIFFNSTPITYVTVVRRVDHLKFSELSTLTNEVLAGLDGLDFYDTAIILLDYLTSSK